jgi:hypothetical protein
MTVARLCFPSILRFCERFGFARVRALHGFMPVPFRTFAESLLVTLLAQGLVHNGLNIRSRFRF